MRLSDSNEDNPFLKDGREQSSTELSKKAILAKIYADLVKEVESPVVLLRDGQVETALKRILEEIPVVYDSVTDKKKIIFL